MLDVLRGTLSSPLQVPPCTCGRALRRARRAGLRQSTRPVPPAARPLAGLGCPLRGASPGPPDGRPCAGVAYSSRSQRLCSGVARAVSRELAHADTAFRTERFQVQLPLPRRRLGCLKGRRRTRTAGGEARGREVGRCHGPFGRIGPVILRCARTLIGRELAREGLGPETFGGLDLLASVALGKTASRTVHIDPVALEVLLGASRVCLFEVRVRGVGAGPQPTLGLMPR
jgi:hypothetical protein